MTRPQVRPRACTSAPPSLNFPNLTGANPSCVAKFATGPTASSSSLDRKTTRWPPSTTGSVARGAATRIKTFHELSAGERLRNEGGGRETAQLFRENSKRVRRVDDRLAFPARQGIRNLAMFLERDSQDDCVGLECIPQRLGDDRGSNRPSLRCQRLGRPATRDCHVDVFTGEGVGEGLAYLTESYNRIAHNASPIRVDIDSPAFNGAGLSVPLCGDLRVDVLP